MRALSILGTRGIPARHGGFETFAEKLALHLVARGWRVTVYGQRDGDGGDACVQREWNGVRLIEYPIRLRGAPGTVVFDWRSTRHAAAAGHLVLTLGYNTAVFCALYRLRGVTNVINMDGMEWRRPKWSAPARAWLYANERLGCALGSHLVADHPEIEALLAQHTPAGKITMIPYGADYVDQADPAPLAALGVTPGNYALVVARPEPENSILEIVRAFGRRDRACDLVLLGELHSGNRYHAEVRAAAGARVRLPGAIYDRQVVSALRRHARLYVHGHTVGGTNPSLVEAMGARCPVLAHDNRFNRWVSGDGAAYFRDEDECARRFDELLDDRARLGEMAARTTQRFVERFTWERILEDYERLLSRMADAQG